MARSDGVSDEVVKDALDMFEDSQQGSEFNRDAYYEDVKFARMSEQWPDAIRKQREQEARPCLTINKMPALIRSVVNQSRQNKPAIKISPVDSGADEETAEVIGGLVRSVERGSNAEIAYDTSIDQAITGGFGFFRIGIDYAHDETFDLKATIERIPNSLMVHWDTSSTKFDASDWDYAFVSEMVKEEEYKRRWPEASMVPFDGSARDEATAMWTDEDAVRVAEYFKRESVERNLLQLAVMNPQTQQEDLQTVREDQLPEMARRFFEAGGIDISGLKDPDLIAGFMEISGVTERRRRKVEAHKVIRRVMNGVETLDEEEWPGSMIPICPVWGDETFIDGRRHFRSMIRDAKDPQMMFNFWRSASTELVALAPKTPWLGPKGFIPKGQESKWASANTRNHSYLEFNPESGPPSRQQFAGVPAGVLQESMNAADDMKAITGIYDSSVGARSNETSGKAILARERQGDVSNFHFIDNLNRAIRYAGQVLVEIIPSVYSAQETVRILGEDQRENVIKLTQEGSKGFEKGPNGGPALYNLAVGQYDVTVSTGPSFATEREETRETLLEIMRAVPDAAPFVGDVLLDHMDFVGADKVSKRLRQLLPPEIRKSEDAEGNEDNPEAAMLQQQLEAKDTEVQQMVEQAKGQFEQITKENEALKADKSAATMKVQVDAEAKAKELELKERELALKEAEALLKAQEQPEDMEATWAYEQTMAREKMAFDADQNAKDREVDLAKAIISKSDGEEGDEGAEMALTQAAAMMAAPKRVVRDENGLVVGVETVTQ